MCGISAILCLEGHSSAKRTNDVSDHIRSKISRELDQSLDMIAHRGPDSRGIWISEDNRVALSHCRLAINDLTPDGYQPMHDTDGGIHTVVNGEIYDYDRIRAHLSQEFNYKFQGHSDSELVVALYKYYGSSFLEQLRGEFALCLYDSTAQFFMAARDRYGVKPLLWTVVDGRLLIAPEAKALLPLGWKPEWDVRALMDESWHFGCRTSFKGVQKVRPGEYLTCTAFSLVESREYWDIEYPDKYRVETRTEEEMIAGVRQRLLEAIRLRLRADVPIGIYLSGGIDSSAVAGIVAHLVREQGEKMGNKDATDRIACFSIAFDKDSGFDESDVAARTASWLDVKQHTLHVGEAEIAASLSDATYHCEHHNMNLNFVGKFALSQVPRELGYRVVLTGEGADEQFVGYPWFIPDFLKERDHSWPDRAIAEKERQLLLEEQEQSLTEFYGSRGADFSTHLPDVVAHELNDSITAAVLTGYPLPAHFWADWIVGQVRGLVPLRLQTIANDVSVRVKHKIQRSWHPVHSGMYIWSKSHLANVMLSCLGDRTEMAHSIEARTPFLDHELTTYANNLPPSVKLRYDSTTGRFTEKWILREAARPFISPELYERKKAAYTAPVVYSENGPLQRYYEKLLTKEKVEELGFLKWEAVMELREGLFIKDAKAMRILNVICQWIILGKRFGITRAEPLR
ncbi:MAG: hypothetical protein Q9167_004182 [Letrouitia subvulpina]